MRGIEAEVLPECQRRGVGILGYGPLAQGLLTGKFTSFDELPAIRARTRHFRGDRPGSRHGEPGCESETWSALEQLRLAAARVSGLNTASNSIGSRLGELALAWAVMNPAVTCTLVGARTRAQLEANIRAAETPLDSALYQEFNQLTESLRQRLGSGIDYHQGRENSRCW